MHTIHLLKCLILAVMAICLSFPVTASAAKKPTKKAAAKTSASKKGGKSARSVHRGEPEKVATSDGKHMYQKKCDLPDKPNYKYGTGGEGCDAQAGQYGDAVYTRALYRDYIYDRRSSDDGQLSRYITFVYNLVRQISSDYFKRQNPGASDGEVALFTRGMLAMAEQESVLSQYRISNDNHFKLNIGDQGRSHGMMQINQYYNYSKNPDNSLDLVGNISYGVSFVYQKYVQTEHYSCVDAARKAKGATGQSIMIAHLRTAYAFYNGGDGCSWIHTDRKGRSKMPRDYGFYDHFTGQKWASHVTETKKPALNIGCILNNDRVCSLATRATTPAAAVPTLTHPIAYDDGSTCLLAVDKQTQVCSQDIRTFVCATHANANLLHNSPVAVAKRSQSAKVSMLTDRAAICQADVRGILPIGSFLKVKKDIPMRIEILGIPAQPVKAGSVLQIIDFDVMERSDGVVVSYKVRSGDKDGYILAGSPGQLNENVEAASETEARSAEMLIPIKGSVVEITKSGGIIARATPSDDGKVLSRVSAHTKLQVKNVILKNSDNDVYLEVSVNGVKAYVYAGHTDPMLSINSWMSIAK